MPRIFYFILSLISSLQRRRRRRLTSAGVLIVGALIASAISGLDTNQTMNYQLFTLLLCLLVVSIIFTFFFRGRFNFKRKLPRLGTVGVPVNYKLIIRNHSKKVESGLSIFDEIRNPDPSFDEFLTLREPGEEKRNRIDRSLGYFRWAWISNRKKIAQSKKERLPPLPPGIEVELKRTVMPLRRGKLTFTGVTVMRPDPFGVINAVSKSPLSESVLILPRRYPLPLINLPGIRRYQHGGIAAASSIGDAEEFVSLREYRAGDPLRRIDWKSWAKTDKPMVREYQEEFFVRHALILDTFQSVPVSERFEEAVSIAASFVCTIDTMESLLDLIFIGTEWHCFTAGRGQNSREKLLEILSTVELCTDKKPFSTLKKAVTEQSSALSGSICILLDWDEERREFVAHLRSLGVPVKVLVVIEALNVNREDFDLGPMKDIPENFHLLEVGKIEEGLARI